MTSKIQLLYDDAKESLELQVTRDDPEGLYVRSWTYDESGYRIIHEICGVTQRIAEALGVPFEFKEV